MANTPLNDLIMAKLAARFPAEGATLGDLWRTYSYSVTAPDAWLCGQALYDHYGGPELTLTDRAQRFWGAFVP
jgi:hypothetical protein